MEGETGGNRLKNFFSNTWTLLKYSYDIHILTRISFRYIKKIWIPLCTKLKDQTFKNIFYSTETFNFSYISIFSTGTVYKFQKNLDVNQFLYATEYFPPYSTARSHIYLLWKHIL